MVVKVGINGFGRIGRLVLRALLEMDEKVDIVAINDIASNDALAHLFEFDSAHGRFQGSVRVTEDKLIFNDDPFVALSERDPTKLPWKELDADFVVESTGVFRTREGLQKHREAGAKKVLLSAPAKSSKEVDITLVRGINTHEYDPSKHHIVSNASCTTNCLAPVAKVLDDNFGFEQGTMTTIHGYTNDQRLLDSFHRDFRRMRSAALNMFPTSTGASKAIGLVLPQLAGKIDGLAIRVPIPNVSLVDMTARMERNVTTDEVADAFREAANGYLKGIIAVEWRSLVSSDYNHNKYSATVDLPTLKVIDNNLVSVLSWYDNEWGYANRTAELIHELYEKRL
ncbi:MAG: type I glyceraldehyde-3-phosphate dehydrogenase [Candidatus Hodarchaeales archaeon]